MDKAYKVGRNKARLIVKGYSQQEGINFTRTFALVAPLEVTHNLHLFIAHRSMKLYQINVKSLFLNIISEKVYVEQLPGFKSNVFLITFSNSTKHYMV